LNGGCAEVGEGGVVPSEGVIVVVVSGDVLRRNGRSQCAVLQFRLVV
jgi:hypothetical protein